MKVNQPPPAQGDPGANKTAPTLSVPARTDQGSPITSGRSFASVLDSVVGDAGDSHEDATGATNSESPGSEAPAPAHPERQKAEPEDDRILPIITTQPQVTFVEDIDGVPTPGARQILHASDIDTILTTVRTELAGSQPQVTLDLPRSVLQGLRVKLGADRTGRISVEFIARNESVRSQIAARSPDLIDMLRLRGIELATFKTSVSGDPAGQGQQNHSQTFAADGTSTANVASRVAEVTQPPDEEGDLTSRFTYRA